MKNDIVFCANDIKYEYNSKSFKYPVLDGISLKIKEKEVVGILGPNGCGKTTLLKVLTGLLRQTSGSIEMDAEGELCLGMIFQEIEKNLMPWRTVLDNVALLGLVTNKGKVEARKIAENVLKRLNLSNLSHRYPSEISGGQKQLVILARWMAFTPVLLFIDEGWSMLDFVQRKKVSLLIRELVDTKNCSICIVSHDLNELSGLSDRVLVLTKRPSKIACVVEFDRDEAFYKKNRRLWEKVQEVFIS